VFISSGFRTAFGQDESHVEEVENHKTSESDEGSGEAPLAAQEPSEDLHAAAGEQETKGKLQVDPAPQSRTEILDSTEDGEVDAGKKDSDVEDVPKEPETEQFPDRPKSGNLDAFYGKRSLYTFAGRNYVCRNCGC
jgi:hypothetical protein